MTKMKFAGRTVASKYNSSHIYFHLIESQRYKKNGADKNPHRFFRIRRITAHPERCPEDPEVQAEGRAGDPEDPGPAVPAGT